MNRELLRDMIPLPAVNAVGIVLTKVEKEKIEKEKIEKNK
jgi:hypothetical protein